MKVRFTVLVEPLDKVTRTWRNDSVVPVAWYAVWERVSRELMLLTYVPVLPRDLHSVTWLSLDEVMLRTAYRTPVRVLFRQA